MNTMLSTIVYVCFAYCILLMTSAKGRNLPTETEDNENVYIGHRDCSSMLMKSMADLLLSEYNRVTLTNQRLYLLSREPNILCKESISSCIISLKIQASSCNRLTSSQRCSVAADTENTKTCFGVVDLTKPEMKNPLMCQDDTEKENENKAILQLQMSSLSNLNSKLTDKFMKKQWDECGGISGPFRK